MEKKAKARPNKKRRPRAAKRTKPASGGAFLSRARAAAFTAFLGLLCTLGLWRCLEGQGRPQTAAPRTAAPFQRATVEKAPAEDPTLLAEKRLIEEEMPRLSKAGKSDGGIGERPAEAEEPVALESRPKQFPGYAVAFQFHAQVRDRPATDGRVVGYARRGAAFRVSPKIAGGGCSRGWHEIAPGGLFVCNGEGVIVSDEPVGFAPAPPLPDLDAAMPYRYHYVTAPNTPEYWRLPTPEEAAETEALFERAEERDSGSADPEALPSYVHMRMAKGFYLSTDDRVDSDAGVAYTRTIRGRFVPADRLAPASPSSFAGQLIGEARPLPRVFVVAGGVRALDRRKEGAPIRTGELIERFTALPFLGEMAYRGRRYLQVAENRYVMPRVAVVAQAVSPPQGIGPDERWIDVDLKQQTLVAYEGKNPVFATLVSTGREGFETPTGEFRVTSKHVAITMDDPNRGAEAYSIEDVPWTQYFQDSFALHGAFWHNRFGQVHSHGCVNLAPEDARRLFFWTGPRLPNGLHGIAATRDNPGTRVIIH